MSNAESGKEGAKPASSHLAQTIVGNTAQTISTPGVSPTISVDGSIGNGSVIRHDDSNLKKALESLPSYEIDAKLGEGGMGAVYRARQRALNRTVALKVLPQRLCDNPLYVARLNREALVLAKLNHPNVIGCFDLGEHQGMRYVVMEYVEGESLSALIDKRKTLPQAEALHYIKQAVLGLDHANAIGIIHRDIKPDNMLLAKAISGGTTSRLSGGFLLKIADLGLATFTTEQSENTRLTTEGSTLGSPYYMSPEQTIGASDLDFRTDIYALGITLYHMLTGKLPYEANSIGAVLARKLSESIKDPRELRADLAPALSLLIQKMTARNKDDRYASYGDLLHDIESLERGVPLAAKILPPERASLALSSATIEQLGAARDTVMAGGYEHPAQASGGKRTASALSTYIAGAVMLTIATVAVLGFSKTPRQVPPATPATVQPASIADTKAATVPTALPQPAKTTPAPTPVVFETKSLIEDHSTSGWTYAGDKKDFGFQDGTLFLNSFKKEFNVAQHPLPANEFILRVLAQLPRETDDCEVHVGIGPKYYIAFGLRWLPGSPKVQAYVEKRESKTHTVVEQLAKQEGLNPDDWQNMRVNLWDRQATCFLANQLLVSAEVEDGNDAAPAIRIAANNGFAQFQLIEVSPRPVSK